ncbi:MAG: CvpA family protein [Fibrobacter sp.]|uniref:CvpA family protein n=1 Tax=Fibrobacter sp. TaxID=35828 RepID=UPI0025B94B10|nr:CvpA family protein [Fibrobacter sp.]MBR4784318.1 CvpA family protein [Fibrobacter sp.]
MNWIDIVCLICILVLTLIGIWRGFLKDVFRLVAWAAALAGAYFAQDLLADTIATNLAISGFTVKLVSICIGFLVPFILLFMIGHFVQKSIANTSAGKLNRILGGILGACKAWVICFIFLSILHILPVSGDLKETRNDAIAYNFYKFNLELLGFSSDEVDLVGFAEKKASEFSKEITDKAVEKVKETTTQAAEQAKDAAVQAAEDVKDAAVNAAKETTDKAVSTVKEKVESTTQSK